MNQRSIVETALRHGGHISHAQLMELGLTDSAIHRRIETGTLERVARGVYRVAAPKHAIDIVRGAMLALPNATVSHHTAAFLHGIEGVGPHPLTVMVHTRTTHRFPGVRVRRCHDLSPGHVTKVSELPSTTLSRTLVDLAAVLPDAALSNVLDTLLATGRVSVENVSGTLEDVARKGKPGVASLRALLLDRGVGTEGRMSRLERLGLDLIRSADLPTPELEYAIPWDTSRRFDVAFPEHKVAIEWDSVAWHASPDRFEGDRRRDRSAVRHGWVVLRFTWKDVSERGESVIAETNEVLAMRSPGRHRRTA